MTDKGNGTGESVLMQPAVRRLLFAVAVLTILWLVVLWSVSLA